MRQQITAIATFEYVLVLNPMTGNTEQGAEFGPFPTRDAALAFYNGEKVENYSEEGPNMFGPEKKKYQKAFRKGGLLEWMNPLHPTELEQPGIFNHGIHEVVTKLDAIQKVGFPF